METNRIRQFCAVYEIKNLRRAAEILGISHSALSKSLKVFQDEIGVALFQPDGRGLIPTDSANRLYSKFKHFLEIEAEILAPTQKTHDTCRIGTFEVFSTHLLGTLWTKYFGDAQLELHELVPGRLEKALSDGKIDAGLTYEPIPTPGIEFVRVGKIRMGFFVRKGAFKNLTSDQIPFVAPIAPLEGAPTGVRGLDGWPDDKIERRISFRVDMMESGLALVRAGSAGIFLPIFVARLHNAAVKPENCIEERALPGKMKSVFREVYLVRRSSTPETKLLRNLGKLIRVECLS